MKPLLLLAIALLFILGVAILPNTSLASYSVTPLIIDKELEKRDIVEETITLTNNSDRLVRIYTTVNEVAQEEGQTVQTFITPSMTDRTTSITSWLEISRKRIELQPGESKAIPLTIRVNPEVAPGEYHAFIGFAEASNRPDAEAKVYGGNVPGTVVRISVDKVQNQFLRLARFTVERFIKSNSEGDIEYTLHNPGEDPVVPRGEIIFYDNNGVEVATAPINSDNTVVEPGDEVAFKGEVPDTMRMGKYKAFLSVEFGEHQVASVHDTAFFYVLPLKLLLIIFAAVLILAIAGALYVHRKFDVADTRVDADDVAMYIRDGRSEDKEHDIDLSKKTKE